MKVISLGGSIIVPDNIDIGFLRGFLELIKGSQGRFIIICGGGKVCRRYQDAARGIGAPTKDDLDWIGIRSTRLNAELIRSAFGDLAYEKIILDPYEDIQTDKKIMIGGGFEPGSSTDLRAVQLASRFGADEVINMSDIDHVYDKDPKDPDASPLDKISFDEFGKLVGDTWDPGLNMPFDPIATREAKGNGLKIRIISKEIENLRRVLEGKTFTGTTIY